MMQRLLILTITLAACSQSPRPPDYPTTPTVTNCPTTACTIVVLGAVHASGSIQFRRGMSVLDALSLAGGVTAIAWKSRIRVRRTESGRTVTFRVNADAISDGRRPNMMLAPGDEVFVDTRWL